MVQPRRTTLYYSHNRRNPGSHGKLGAKPTRFRHCKRGARVFRSFSLDQLRWPSHVVRTVRHRSPSSLAQAGDGKTQTRVPIRKSGDRLSGTSHSLGANNAGEDPMALSSPRALHLRHFHQFSHCPHHRRTPVYLFSRRRPQTHTLAGRVVDPQGRPVAGATSLSRSAVEHPMPLGHRWRWPLHDRRTCRRAYDVTVSAPGLSGEAPRRHGGPGGDTGRDSLRVSAIPRRWSCRRTNRSTALANRDSVT